MKCLPVPDEKVTNCRNFRKNRTDKVGNLLIKVGNRSLNGCVGVLADFASVSVRQSDSETICNANCRHESDSVG
jgi:hypothetical protein